MKTLEIKELALYMGGLCQYRLTKNKKPKTAWICPAQLAYMEEKIKREEFAFIHVVLRPMSKMTVEQATQLVKIGYTGTKDWIEPIKFLGDGFLYNYTYSGSRRIHRDGGFDYNELNPQQIVKLLEWRYDIFKWIEKGWGVDATKILEPA